MTSETTTGSTETDRITQTIPADADLTESLPTAVAVRIGNRELWIGNRGAAQPANLEKLDVSPDRIISVNQKPTAATTDHHSLVDGYVNDQSVFNAAVDTTREAYRNDGTVLVHCSAGISRSSTVIATALASEESIPLNDAIDIDQRFRRRARPHEKLQINGQSYLAGKTDRVEAQDQLTKLADRIQFSPSDQRNALNPVNSAGGEQDILPNTNW
jgi:atypical dual specificity phosphatase